MKEIISFWLKWIQLNKKIINSCFINDYFLSKDSMKKKVYVTNKKSEIGSINQ